MNKNILTFQRPPLTFTTLVENTTVRFYYANSNYPETDLSKFQYRTLLNNETEWSEWTQYEVFTKQPTGDKSYITLKNIRR